MKTFDPQKDIQVTVTPEAQSHIKRYVLAGSEKKQSKIFRLTVKTTGCSGLAYDPQVLDKPVSEDIKVQVNSEDLDVYVDASCVKYINGLVIGVNKKALGQTELTFENPNETARCGCGISFSVDEQEG
jgi:iron-sulfur cluster assembly protein